ncbi:S1C family serine protease [Roseateles sp. BYS180W]|uniref:S1C family serine protease n=1 Tax=Roseateles rivi TaxID=3299028 RepID=A0ABW7FW25_9BURK
MSALRRYWLIFAQATTVGLAGLFVVSTLKPQWLPVSPKASSSAAAVSGAAAVVATRASGQISYAAAARAATPAVVSVTASKSPRAGQRSEGWQALTPEDRLPTRTGLGSGVIVSEQGYLLTNNHVVEGASDIRVQLADGRQAQADLVGTDPETDLAVLRIALPNLPVLRLGRSAQLEVGDIVLAIGNPFNVGQTVTSGIVSALGRNQLGINTFENFIQTDAAINPGNSGGALVDIQGQLVGINTAIYSRRGGGSVGIGFAIPVDTANQVMQSLVRDGQVTRGWIGIQPRELSPELIQALQLRLPADTLGVLVGGVLRGAPAARSGIQPGDVVLRIGGQAVHNPAELLQTVSGLKPSSTVVVDLLRGADALTVTLQVAQRPRQARLDTKE